VAPTERIKVLAVDDNPANLLALKALLERPDCEIVTAQSGDEALRHLLREQFAAILLDVAMPGADGFETAALIREREKTRFVPIIFITATQFGMERAFRGYSLGAVDYLTKPIDPDVLKAKVAVFVQLFRQARLIGRQAEALLDAEHREREVLEAMYRDTFEEAPIGIGHTDIDGRWRRVNRRLAEILGYPQDELLSRPLADLLHRDDRPRLAEAIARVLGGAEERHCGEYRFIRRDNALVWAVLRISLLRDPTGRPVQLNIMEDVTELRRTELALQASETRFARLLQSGILAVAFQDSREIVQDANDAFLILVGYSREDLHTQRIDLRAATPVEFRDLDRCALEQVRQSGFSRPYEKEYLRKDGSRIPVLIGASAADGISAGIISFALDISERKQREKERASVLRDLRDAIRTRDDFLSIAAHELKTPLTPIRLQVQSLRMLAEERSPLITPALLEKQLEPVERAVARMEKLIAMLLDVSRLTVGKFKLELDDVNLAAIVREVAERMRWEMDCAGCKLALHAGRAIAGRWDRLRLELVASNLLSNAVKYGAGKPIEVTVEGDNETARLRVRDHGIGIAPEVQPLIFERFERLVPVRHFGGFGLGLWIVRQIVEAHGGRVELWSRPGEGSRFTIHLPRATSAEQQS
jgi:PAS domain S-box-containing protein